MPEGGNRGQVGVQTTPLVVEGIVYVGDGHHVVHAFDAETGAQVNEFELGGYGRAGASLGSTRTGKTRAYIPVSGRGGAPNKLVCLGLE